MDETLVREVDVHQHEYLSRAHAPGGPIRVILDAPGGGPRIGHEGCWQHVEGMLQSHGWSISGE